MKETIKKYIRLQKEAKILYKKYDEIINEQFNIKSQFEKYIFEHHLYEPIEKLKEYNEQDLESITVISDTGVFETWSNYDYLEIRDNHLYVNDESCLKVYDEQTGKYHTHTFGYKDDGIKIIGYINLIKEHSNEISYKLYEIIEKYLESEE